jgi:hypothetical protein
MSDILREFTEIKIINLNVRTLLQKVLSNIGFNMLFGMYHLQNIISVTLIAKTSVVSALVYVIFSLMIIIEIKQTGES